MKEFCVTIAYSIYAADKEAAFARASDDASSNNEVSEGLIEVVSVENVEEIEAVGA